MRIKLLHIFLVIFFSITVFSSCSKLKSVTTPDKIIVYKNGTEIIIEKDNPLFNKILDECVKRFNYKIGIEQIYIGEDWESDIKSDKLSLEFRYSSEQIFNFDSTRETQLRYSRLLFPLVLEKSFLQGDENYMAYGDYERYKSGLIGKLTYSEELINLVIGIE